MLRAGLIFIQLLAAFVITEKAEVIALATGNGGGYRWTTDDQFLVSHTRQVLELLQFDQKFGGYFFGSIFAKLE